VPEPTTVAVTDSVKYEPEPYPPSAVTVSAEAAPEASIAPVNVAANVTDSLFVMVFRSPDCLFLPLVRQELHNFRCSRKDQGLVL